MRHLSLVHAIAVLALLFAHPQLEAAENGGYPTKPIRLIIPFPPGGGNDVIGRMIAIQLSPRLGKTVVVDNRGGGGGVLGSNIAAQAIPDGYTVLLVSATFTVTPWLYKLPYDPAKAFTPVALIANSPNLLAVNASIPVNSVRELISLAQAKPGELRYASGGVGSNPHLSAALFGSLTKTKLTHVPFRGTGPMIVSVVGGETQMCIGPLVALLPHVRANRVKALGTGGAARSAVLPQVPTIDEAGVAGYESSNWWGIVAPAGTPSAAIARLHAEIADILRTDETRQAFAMQGAEAMNISAAEFQKRIVAETARWGAVVKELGLQRD